VPLLVRRACPECLELEQVKATPQLRMEVQFLNRELTPVDTNNFAFIGVHSQSERAFHPCNRARRVGNFIQNEYRHLMP
jgi:hypothetical protein